MRQVYYLACRSDCFDYALHGSDKGISVAEVGDEGDERGHANAVWACASLPAEEEAGSQVAFVIKAWLYEIHEAASESCLNGHRGLLG